MDYTAHCTLPGPRIHCSPLSVTSKANNITEGLSINDQKLSQSNKYIIAESTVIGVFSQLDLKAACGQCICTHEALNSETQCHVTLINPQRGNTFPLVQSEIFLCASRSTKGKKKECAITSAPCCVHLMPR